jgi:oligopeptide transport system substrate-binding protein
MHKRLFGILASVAVIVAACGGATSSSAPPASTAPGQSAAPAQSAGASQGGALAADQTLREYLAATDPASFNPQLSYDSTEIAVLSATNRSMLYYDKDLGLVPMLAQDMPTVADGGKTLTFKLKDGLKYSNGDPIVAADFVRSARKLADPRLAAAYGYEMCYVQGASEVLGTDFGCSTGTTPYKDPAKGTFDDAQIDGLLDKLGFEAPDPQTLVVHLATPVNFFTNIMAMWLTSPTAEKQTTYAEASDIISSGPFMFDGWTHNSEITLVPNPNWTAGTKPTLTKIVMTIGGDPEAATASYEKGDLDLVQVPSTSAARVIDDPNLKDQVKDVPQTIVSYYDFANCGDGPKKCPPSTTTANGFTPMMNKNFRIALTEAIDKQELINVAYAGLGVPASSSVMPGIKGWPDDYNPYPYDVDKANQTMATALTELGIKDTTGPAGTPDGKVTVLDVGKLKFGFNCDAGHTPRVTYLAGAWRKNLGFSESQFDIACTDFAVYKQERRAGNVYDIQRNAWGADFPNPDNQLRDLFFPGAGNNNAHYNNPAFNDLVNQASVEQDPAKAHDLYVQAQRLLVDDAPVIWLNWQTIRNMVKPYVGGITATAKDSQNIGDLFPETIQILQH